MKRLMGQYKDDSRQSSVVKFAECPRDKGEVCGLLLAQGDYEWCPSWVGSGQLAETLGSRRTDTILIINFIKN